MLTALSRSRRIVSHSPYPVLLIAGCVRGCVSGRGWCGAHQPCTSPSILEMWLQERALLGLQLSVLHIYTITTPQKMTKGLNRQPQLAGLHLRLLLLLVLGYMIVFVLRALFFMGTPLSTFTSRLSAYSILSPRTATASLSLPWAPHDTTAPVFTWFAIVPPTCIDARFHGGASIVSGIAESDLLLHLKSLHATALRMLEQLVCRTADSGASDDGQGRIVSAWRRESYLQGGYLFLGQCLRAPSKGILAYVIGHENYTIRHRSFDLTSPVSILVPAACWLDELLDFVDHLTAVLAAPAAAATGRSVRIIIGWGECPDSASSVHQPQTPDGASDSIDAAQLSAVARGIPIILRKTGLPFSRASTLNAALGAADDDDIVVMLDTDMRVTELFFVHVGALVVPAASIYFPIAFSRYNPALIDKALDLQSDVTAEARARYHALSTIHHFVGAWVTDGYGMLAASAKDLHALGGYNASNTAWGMEDVDVWAAAKASNLSVLRLVESGLVHIWHPKNCAGLRENARRYRMCIGSKGLAEGSAIMLAMELHAALETSGSCSLPEHPVSPPAPPTPSAPVIFPPWSADELAAPIARGLSLQLTVSLWATVSSRRLTRCKRHSFPPRSAARRPSPRQPAPCPHPACLLPKPPLHGRCRACGIVVMCWS